MSDHRPVLEARRLTKRFRGARTGLLPKRRDLVPVDDVSLTLAEGRVTALVGESGSGKSVLSKMLARIVKPTSGELLLDGAAVPTTSKHRLEYARHVQLVLQDPFSAMNPVHTVHYHLERALRIHGTARADVEDGIRRLLERVALSPADRFASAFPHELSGGQLQRVSVARALAAKPRVLLADEPVSMLDVSVRLGLLNLLADLRDQDDLAILYITHDIASARYLADEIVVMYLGQVVEVAPAKELTASPNHPYTKLLIASSPDPDRLGRTPRKIPVTGARPDAPGSGCRFRRRCPYAEAICATEVPPLFPAGDQSTGTHLSRCWLADPGRTLESERNPPSALVGPARDHLTTSEEKEVAAPTAPLNSPENGGRARPADNVEHSQK